MIVVDEKLQPWHSPQFYREAHAVAAQRIRFVAHEGRRILMVDFSHAELEMVRAVAAECLHVMAQEPKQSVLSLVDTEAIPFSTEALRVGAELTDRVQPYALRTAVVGVTGFRTFMLQTIANAARRPIKLFNERLSALEWLIKDDSK
jgi:hypothetical protein